LVVDPPMSKLVILASLSLSACAIGGGGFGATRDLAPSAKVQLSTRAAPDGARTAFPRVIAPALPRVDWFAYQIRARLGDDSAATVRLCVSAAGRVTKVALVKGTTFEAFDQALVRDVEEWQFAPQPGPANVEACHQARIAYRAPH
jgi:TonB family protein